MKYYLLSDLPTVLGVTEQKADDVKTNIMQHFWLGKLKLGLFYIPTQSNLRFTIESNIASEKPFDISREFFQDTFFDFFSENSDTTESENTRNPTKQKYLDAYFNHMSANTWEYYKREFNEAEVIAKQAKSSEYLYWFRLCFPRFAVSLWDLRLLMKKDKDPSNLLNRLPPLPRGVRNKYEKAIRNKAILEKARELDALGTMTKTEIAKKIHKELPDYKNLSEHTVRSIISRYENGKI